MAESKVKDGNYYVVQSFMVKELKLKGLEKDVYAIIYGFSQAGQKFNGSLQYLADWTTSTKQGVLKSLKSLQDKGLVVKEEKQFNGVKFCEYYTTEFNTPLNKVEEGIKQSLTGGIQQSLPNNKSLNNNSDNKEDKKKESKVAEINSFDLLIEKYLTSEDGKSIKYQDYHERKELLQEWLKVRKAKRAAMTDRAIELNLQKLDKLAAKSNMSVVEYLKEVICRGWQAFYEIKNFNQQPKQSSQENLDFDRKYGTVL